MLGIALVQHFRAPVLPTDAVTFAGGRFFLGRRRLPRWELLWKLEWFDRVFDYCSQLLRRTQAAKLASQMLEGSLRTEQQVPSELRCWLGFSGTEPAVFDLVQQGPHSLVIGPTGVGKSQLIRLMLHGLTTSLNPSELRLCLLDFKGGATLGEWFEHPSTQAAATDLDSSYEPVLNWLGQQLELRERYLAEHFCSRFESLPVGEQLPRLLVVVDELQPLLKLNQASVVEDIAARGRSLGIQLVATAQSTLGLSRGLVTNTGLRFLISVDDPVELAQLGLRAEVTDTGETPGGNWRICRFRSAAGTGTFVFPLGLGNGSTTSEKIR